MFPKYQVVMNNNNPTSFLPLNNGPMCTLLSMASSLFVSLPQCDVGSDPWDNGTILFVSPVKIIINLILQVT